MIFQGNLIAQNLNIAIVVSRFNEFITSKLLSGAMDTLQRHGVNHEEIDIAWVPGAFELPLIAKKLANTKKYQAIIVLGAVIRGATTHYDYICNEVTKGIAQISQQQEIPIIFGVITTENIEQAVERAGTKMGNKGSEAAISAIEMANLMYNINLVGGNTLKTERREVKASDFC